MVEQDLRAGYSEEQRQAERVCLSPGDAGDGFGRQLPHRMSFREAIAVAERQVGMNEIRRTDPLWPVMYDICRVMAEVYMAPPNMMMKMNGEELAAGMIAEVYRELTSESVTELATRIGRELGTVRFIKAYLRSALYNQAFEYEASIVRLCRETLADWGG